MLIGLLCRPPLEKKNTENSILGCAFAQTRCMVLPVVRGEEKRRLFPPLFFPPGGLGIRRLY
jgi:hypothetical protein